MRWLLPDGRRRPYQPNYGVFELSNTKPFEQSELIRLALAGLDAEIADLQQKRAHLASLTNQPSTNTKAVSTAPPQKGGKMSEEAKAKISAAATARWAKVKEAKAEAEKSATAAKKTPSKKSSVKAQKVSTKGKKSPAKKGKKASSAPSAETA